MSDNPSLPGFRKPAPVVANDDGLLSSYEEVGGRLIAFVESVLCSQCDGDDAVLDARDIQEILGALRNVPGLMPKLLHGLIAPHQAMRFVRDPFSRALVQPFSHLLEKANGPSLENGAISRRFLPGFFVAIRLMVGGERYNSFQTVCEDVLAEERLAPNTDPDSTEFWDEYMAREEVNDVVAEVYARFLLCFDPYDKRKGWFIKLINSKLGALPSVLSNEPSSQWRFDDHHFLALMSTMLENGGAAPRADILAAADRVLGAAKSQRIRKIVSRIQ